MRYKTAPGPVELVGLEALAAAHDALPLVPEDVDDCCARVVDRTAVPDREEAREWITLLQALDLAEETPRGYRRVRAEVGDDSKTGAPDALADAFEATVFGVAELCEALTTAGPLTVDESFDRLRPAVPAWERERHADWVAVWTGRVERLLAWCVAFGLAECDGDRYRTAEQ
ncbi:MAG: hypothetical protein V5A44_06565 [Haloarculaceae archaeon]